MRHFLTSVCFAILCSLPAWATAYTATTTGNWNVAATWGGTGVQYPHTGDTFTIPSGKTVTCPASVTCVFGTSGASGTTDGTIAGELDVSGTLTLQGDIQINQTGTFKGLADGIAQFQSPSGAYYKIKDEVEFNGAPFPQFTTIGSSWAHPFTIQTIGGNVGANGQINISFEGLVNMTYTKASNLGSSGNGTNNAWLLTDLDVIMTHVLVVGSGHWQHYGRTASKAYVIQVDDFHVRNSADVSPLFWLDAYASFGWPAAGSYMRNSSFQAASGNYLSMLVRVSNMTFTNVAIDGYIGFDNGSQNGTMNNVLIAPFVDDGSGQFLTICDNSGWTLGNTFFWPVGDDGVSASATFNPHEILLNGSSPTNISPTVIYGAIVKGNSNGRGDLAVFPTGTGIHSVTSTLIVNGAGNIDDGTGNNASAAGVLNHNTVVNAGSGATAVSLEEQQGSYGTKIQQLTNFIADSSEALMGIGTCCGPYTWVPMSNFTYDYVWWTNPVSVATPTQWNPGTNHSGAPIVETLYNQGTVTVSVKTSNTQFTVTGSFASSILPGMTIYFPTAATSAPVLTSSSGVITLGTNNAGVAGLPSAIVGSSFQVQPQYWSSGAYGDSGKGLHEYYASPRFVDPTRTNLQWDTYIGGPGTNADALTQMYQSTGWDINGAAVTPNSLVSIALWAAFMRRGYQPTNLAMAGMASDPSWAGTTAYTRGVTVVDRYKHLQLCLTGGTSGSSSAVFNANNAVGTSTTDGTVVWIDQGYADAPGALPLTTYNTPGGRIR